MLPNADYEADLARMTDELIQAEAERSGRSVPDAPEAPDLRGKEDEVARAKAARAARETQARVQTTTHSPTPPPPERTRPANAQPSRTAVEAVPSDHVLHVVLATIPAQLAVRSDYLLAQRLEDPILASHRAVELTRIQAVVSMIAPLQAAGLKSTAAVVPPGIFQSERFSAIMAAVERDYTRLRARERAAAQVQREGQPAPARQTVRPQVAREPAPAPREPQASPSSAQPPPRELPPREPAVRTPAPPQKTAARPAPVLIPDRRSMVQVHDTPLRAIRDQAQQIVTTLDHGIAACERELEQLGAVKEQKAKKDAWRLPQPRSNDEIQAEAYAHVGGEWLHVSHQTLIDAAREARTLEDARAQLGPIQRTGLAFKQRDLDKKRQLAENALKEVRTWLGQPDQAARIVERALALSAEDQLRVQRATELIAQMDHNEQTRKLYTQLLADFRKLNEVDLATTVPVQGLTVNEVVHDAHARAQIQQVINNRVLERQLRRDARQTQPLEP